MTALKTSPAAKLATTAKPPTTQSTAPPRKCPAGKGLFVIQVNNDVVRNGVKRITAPSDACDWMCAKEGLKCKKCSTVDEENCPIEDPSKDSYCCMAPNEDKCKCIPRLRVSFNLEMDESKLPSNEVPEAIHGLMYIPKFKPNSQCTRLCELKNMNLSCRKPSKQNGNDENFKCCMKKGISFKVSAEDACRAMPRVELIKRFKKQNICNARCQVQLTNQINRGPLKCIGKFSKLVKNFE